MLVNMKLILGRVFIKEEFIGSNYFNELNKNSVEFISEYKEDLSIPTLIVGWNNVKTLFNNEISILNKKIKPNLFWTFAPDEKYQSFVDDFSKFCNENYNDIIKNCDYRFIDPIIYDICDSNSIIRFIGDDLFDCSYFTEDFIYIYNSIDKIILGIDINYYEVLNINCNLIKVELMNKSKIVLIEDYTDSGVYQIYKKYFNVEFSKKYIPLLETLKQ